MALLAWTARPSSRSKALCEGIVRIWAQHLEFCTVFCFKLLQKEQGSPCSSAQLRSVPSYVMLLMLSGMAMPACNQGAD